MQLKETVHPPSTIHLINNSITNSSSGQSSTSEKAKKNQRSMGIIFLAVKENPMDFQKENREKAQC
jgi:hypothetical protein